MISSVSGTIGFGINFIVRRAVYSLCNTSEVYPLVKIALTPALIETGAGAKYCFLLKVSSSRVIAAALSDRVSIVPTRSSADSFPANLPFRRNALLIMAVRMFRFSFCRLYPPVFRSPRDGTGRSYGTRRPRYIMSPSALLCP